LRKELDFFKGIVIMWGMIIETTKQKVQTSGNIQSASCSIDAEDMRYIASLLRNNYSDTILATIREIIANGIDVSNGRKVEVQLPTKLEPTFIVRDYGCGLSEEDMMGLYTKYGKSTKRDSNNAIGGFGIGRFAPLSYTDSFIVMSVCDGRKTAYTIRVDEKDDTVVSKMSSFDCDEENGIYVQVPVQNKDVEDFNSKFKNFSQYLSEKIKLLNDEFDKTLPAFSTDVFDIYTASGHYRYETSKIKKFCHVLMGGILYPVTISQKYPHLKNGVVYKAKIGEFKLHHSREALEYNDATVAALCKASDKIKNSFEFESVRQLNECETLYEATEFYAEKLDWISQILELKVNDVKWNGFTVQSEVFEYDTTLVYEKIVKNRSGNLGKRKVDRSWDYKGFPKKDRFFIIDDNPSPRAPFNRLSFLEQGEEAYVISNLRDKDLKRAKAMQSPNVKFLSECERKVASRKGQKARLSQVKKSDILELSLEGRYWMRMADFWQEVKEELSDDKTHYYYVYNSNKVESLSGDLIHPHHISTELKALREINPKLEKVKVYGVRKKALNKIEKKSNWVRIDKVRKDWISKSPIYKAQKRKEALKDLLYGWESGEMIKALEKAPSKKVILNFKKLLKEYEKLKSTTMWSKITLSDVPIDISKETKVKEDFLSAYPMVKYAIRSFATDEETKNNLVNYLTNW
jgi:hypothetical protein